MVGGEQHHAELGRRQEPDDVDRACLGCSAGGGTPEGVVDFIDRNHESLGTAPLINGVARLEVHKRFLHLVVDYSGNANYLPAQTDEIHVIPSNER